MATIDVTQGRLTRRAAVAASLAALVPAAAQAQPTLAVAGKNGWLFPLWDRVERVDTTTLRQVVQVIAEATGVLRQARIDVAFCIIPSKARLYRQYLPDSVKPSAEASQRYTVPAGELRRAGAVVPDIDARFREVLQREPNRPLYFRSDTHWTPLGAEIAAVEVARLVKESLRLPQSPRAGMRLGNYRTMTLALGDLVRYVPQAQRKSYGPEESPIREVLAPEGSSALIDDDVSDVQIVGSSNVSPRFGFQPVLSNQLGRPVGLHWRPNNVGPYGTMLEYVRSETFRKSRPRLIVWNLLELDMINLPNNPSWTQFAMTPQAFLSDLRRAVAA